MIILVVLGVLMALSWGLGFGMALRADGRALRHYGQRKKLVHGLEEWLNDETGKGEMV